MPRVGTILLDVWPLIATSRDVDALVAPDAFSSASLARRDIVVVIESKLSLDLDFLIFFEYKIMDLCWYAFT